MKKILFSIAGSLIIFASVSCNKESFNVSNNGNLVFTASIDNSLVTKTTLTSERKVNWDPGDEININGSTYTAIPLNDATKADFVRKSGDIPTSPYKAIFPADLYVTDHFELPATQTYTADKFYAPMYAESETSSLSFKNICGVLCLSLKGTGKIKSITITAHEDICGAFTVSKNGQLSLIGSGKIVTLDCGASGVNLNKETAKPFYLYLPPRTYTSGLEIAVMSTDDNTLKMTTQKDVTIENNKIYSFDWIVDFAEPLVLPGVFTVSGDGRKVRFSKGNLYYDDNYSFHIEKNQYDSPTQVNASHMNFFLWSEDVVSATNRSGGKGLTGSYLFTNNGASTAKSDFIVENVKGIFRSLSSPEWNYLLKKRIVNSGTGQGFSFDNVIANPIKIDGTKYNGLFIFPDDFTEQDTWTEKYDTWEKINNAGIVFLPYTTELVIRTDGTTQKEGYYWTSYSTTKDAAQRLSIYPPLSGYSDGVGANETTSGGYSRGTFACLRLVTEP